MSAVQLSQLGEIVTWRSPNGISFQRLRDALQLAGLDPEMARELLPRYAFSRAVKDLDDQRVIKKVDENATHINFQFTREYFDKSRAAFDYRFEAVLKLNKATGEVQCADTNLASTAHSLVLQQMGQRSSSDVTRIVQNLFKRETKYGDLFPIREQGGAYFVPAHYQHLVEKVSALMAGVGGRLTRYEIPATDTNKQSMAENVSDTIDGVIADCDSAIEDFDPHKGTADAQDKMIKRVIEVRGMIQAYADVLESQVGRLTEKLGESMLRLNDKIEGKTAPPPTPPTVIQPVEVDAIRRLNAFLKKR